MEDQPKRTNLGKWMNGDEITKEGRDTRGKFQPGHKLRKGLKKTPGEVVEPHPTEPHLDIHGRLLEGCNQGGTGHIPGIRAHLQKALLSSIDVDDVRAIMDEIKRLALQGDNEYVRLAAAQTYLDRTIGKTATVKEVTIDKTTTNTTTVLDLSKLSAQEIKLYDDLANKLIASEVVDTTAVPEANATATN